MVSSANAKEPSIKLDQLAIATVEPSWKHQFKSAKNDDTCVSHFIDAGSKTTIKSLLDGTIALAIRSVPLNTKPLGLSWTRWLWKLAGLYHLTHSTQRLMEEAAQKFTAADRKRLAQWAAKKAREETEHDQLALLDIQSMGYQAEAVVKVLVPPAATALVEQFTQSVQVPDPIGCVGYSYTMERLALGVGEKYIQTVEALLNGVHATRCLRVHSSVGSDVKHVEEIVEMVAGLTPRERVQVVINCYQTALLCFSPPKGGYISEEELHDVVQPLEDANNCG